MPIRQIKQILLLLLFGLQCGFAAAQDQDQVAFYVSLNLRGERAETWWPRLLEGSWAAELLEAKPEELPSIFEPKLSLVAGPKRGIAQISLGQPDRVEKALANKDVFTIVALKRRFNIKTLACTTKQLFKFNVIVEASVTNHY